MKKMFSGCSRVLGIGVIVLLCALPCRADGNAVFPDVPKNHWAYAAMDYLLESGFGEGNDRRPATEALSRYSFAVFIARLFQRGTFKESAEAVDAVTALRREFAGELRELGIRDINDLDRETNASVHAPPRLTITPSILHRAIQASTEFPDTPRNHWAFAALQTLDRKKVLDTPLFSPGMYSAFALTRYEIAIYLERLLKSRRSNVADSKIFPVTADAEANDAIAALLKEFGPDVEALALKSLPAEKFDAPPKSLVLVPDTPKTRWIYQVLEQIENGAKNWQPPFPKRDKGALWTRYAVSLAIARMIKQLPDSQPLNTPKNQQFLTQASQLSIAEMIDFIAALHREFVTELKALGITQNYTARFPGDDDNARRQQSPRVKISPSLLQRLKNETATSQTLVPRDAKHRWIYAILEEVNRRQSELGCSLRFGDTDPNALYTRYDLAVATARMMSHSGSLSAEQNILPATRDKEINDALAALTREFKTELRSIGVPTPIATAAIETTLRNP